MKPSPPSWIKRRLLAQHLTDTTPPRRTEEENARRGYRIAVVAIGLWVVVIAVAGWWRGCS